MVTLLLPASKYSLPALVVLSSEFVSPYLLLFVSRRSAATVSRGVVPPV